MAKKTAERPQQPQHGGSLTTANAAPISSANGNERMGNGVSTSDTALSTDEIAARAYEIYEREGRSDGRAMDHWLQAESELRAERQQRQTSPQSRQELP